MKQTAIYSSLDEFITIPNRFARSANLERDLDDTAPLQGYLPTARALDVLDRIISTATASSHGGAWSLTGPYGSGKSSLALLVDAALAPAADNTYSRAVELISDVAPATASALEQMRQQLDAHETGFYRALVTAQREPITHTVVRSLRNAMERRHGKLPSARSHPAARLLREAINDTESSDPLATGPSGGTLVEIAHLMASESPLIIVIDEFGKNLESARTTNAADLYLLQQLAEAGQGVSGAPIFLLTMQHLAFDDYMATESNADRAEWAKIQGRFEDIHYVETAAQTRALINLTFERTSPDLNDRIDHWAQQRAAECSTLGLAELADADLIAGTYPLHPVVTAVLPELCSRYGQNERTLFSFLAGADPATASSFLSEATVPIAGDLPHVGLDRVYDYFAGTGLNIGGSASRWNEITTRIRDAYGLTDPQLDTLKSIAILNLVSSSGALRASAALLNLEAHRSEALERLVDQGIITYRSFSDEYRIWQGTDVDLGGLISSAEFDAKETSLAEILNKVRPLDPAIAARHSAQHDTLRIFARRYAAAGELVTGPDAFDTTDGLCVYVVTNGPPVVPESTSPQTKPIIAAVPTRELTELDRTARRASAINTVLTDTTVQTDWVARRELGEQLAVAVAELERLAEQLFGPRSQSAWTLITSEKPVVLDAGRGTAPLSHAADIAYAQSAQVGNETINRSELSSQGSKARRNLIEAMATSSSLAQLGFEGHGPEVAIYRSLLEASGLHHRKAGTDQWVFDTPSADHMTGLWSTIETHLTTAKKRRVNLKDLSASLQSPPVGLKAGAVPVLITAALMVHGQEVALYEHGTFKPVLSPDVLERLIKNPAHFDIKHFSASSGARGKVIAAYADALGIDPAFKKHRVSNVLAIVAALINTSSRFPNFTKNTSHLSKQATRIRKALERATEPDELLFEEIPKALGHSPVEPQARKYSKAVSLASALADTMRELEQRFDTLRQDLVTHILDTSSERNRKVIAGYAEGLTDEVLDQSLRSFVLALGADLFDDDRDWIENVATVVAKKAPAEWNDDDYARYFAEAKASIGAFQRLVALHAESRVAPGEAFNAIRLTVTRHDGLEQARLIDVDSDGREAIAPLIEALLEDAANKLGSRNRAERLALGLLSERFLGDTATEDVYSENETGSERSHG